MKKAYEVTLKDDNGYKTMTVKAYTLIGATYVIAAYDNVCENLVSINEISFKRYHALNIAAAIREANTWDDCEPECAELCRLAGIEVEWLHADGDTFESVLEKAAELLNVKI